MYVTVIWFDTYVFEVHSRPGHLCKFTILGNVELSPRWKLVHIRLEIQILYVL
jgi:hypothetical protein